MRVNKQKVSFDIDPGVLDEVKKYCVENKMKLSDFYREAVTQRLRRDKDYLTIFAFFDTGIEKFVIDKNNLKVTTWEASPEAMGILNARKEGIIAFKPDTDKTKVQEKILKALEEKGDLKFFIK